MFAILSCFAGADYEAAMCKATVFLVELVLADEMDDRIVIGEIRGGEALDLLQALNTGHAGSMSTIHANTPVDCLRRIETCALLSGIDIPLQALLAQVASAIDAVVHTARLTDGSRKVIAISEVLPLENGDYRVRDIQRWVTDAIAPDGVLSGHFEFPNEPSFLSVCG